MCVYIHTYMDVYILVYIYIYIYMYIYMYIYIYIYILIYTFVYIYIHIFAPMYACTYITVLCGQSYVYLINIHIIIIVIIIIAVIIIDLAGITSSEGGLDSLSQDTIDILYNLILNFNALTDENRELFAQSITELCTQVTHAYLRPGLCILHMHLKNRFCN
jgi:hypothetical protein